MTKQKLLQEGIELASTIHQSYEYILGKPMPNGYYLDNEQGYLNWLEEVQGYVYVNQIYPEQYEEFKKVKDDISPENHKKIIAILNSIK